MKKINWCRKQVKGIKLVEPNDNLSLQYFETAEESLKVLHNLKKSQVWSAVVNYYIKYFAFYSLLIKIGIKCEIHDCTIALASYFEKEDILDKGVAKNLEKDKQLREDNQYFLKNKEVNINFQELSQYLIQIQKTINNLTTEDIQSIRKKLK